MSYFSRLFSDRSEVFCFLLLCLAGFLLRIDAVFTQLWLDEIWSLNLLKNLASPLDILNSLHIDNNHLLNSFYLYFAGPDQQSYIYRLPSLIFGLALLPLVWVVARKNSRQAGCTALIFCSLSYLMVLYSSEARGYSSLLFFSLLCFYLFEKIIDKPTSFGILLFWLSALLGGLSHYGFFMFFPALFIWSVCLWFKGRLSLSLFIKLHLVPLLLLCVLYNLHFRHLPGGSGPLQDHLEVVINSLSTAFGGSELSALRPEQSLFILVFVLFVVVTALSEIYFQWQEEEDRAFFYLLMIFILPLLGLLIFEPRVIFIRYFLLSLLFCYFLLASFFSRVWKISFGGKVLLSLFLFFFFYGNLDYHKRFLKYGRGDYEGALRYMAEHSQQDTISYDSDHVFRNETLVDYYRAALDIDRNFVSYNARSEGQPDWYLAHSQDYYNIPAQNILYKEEYQYKLKAVFPYTAFSGWSWYLYTR